VSAPTAVRPYTGPTVPCASCEREMPAVRAEHPSLHGLCRSCKADERTARPEPPMYETDAWSRGIRL
jgi:hypothetical protein